jgi:hypothetical protein
VAPIAALARLQGVHNYPYLDDILIRNASKEKVLSDRDIMLRMLKQAGFIINLKKSQLTPAQDRVFLGARFRTQLACVQLPVERQHSLVVLLSQFQVGTPLSARTFLRLLGLMASMIPMVFMARLHMRPIQLYLYSQWRSQTKDLEEMIPVNQTLMKDLEFWRDPQNLFKGVTLNRQDPQATITTDAATSQGWGGQFGDMAVQGTWNSQMSRWHINALELQAVIFTLQHFRVYLQNQTVLVKSDNSTVVAYIKNQGGTKSPTLCRLTFQLLTWCTSQGISLKAQFIPGVENIQADRLSRQLASPLEWSLKQSIVQTVFAFMGRPNIDLFASQENHQLPVYCSHLPESQAYCTDSLSMKWTNLFGYAFPPLCLIPQVLAKVKQFQAKIILIAPRWPRRSWFSDLIDLVVETPLVLPTPPDMLSQQKGYLHHPAPEKLKLMAWKLSGKPSEQRAYRMTLSEHYRGLSDNLQPDNITDCGKFLVVGVLPEGYLLARRL